MKITEISRIRILSELVRKSVGNIETSFSSFKFRIACVLTLTAFACGPLYGSFERQAQPAPLWGRGLAGCALHGPDYFLINPASIAARSPVRLVLFHSPSPFGLPELSNGGIALTIPIGSGTIQPAATIAGTSLYREQSALLTYALALDEAVVVGASLSYNALSIERYGAAHTFGIDLGIIVTPIPHLSLGASLLNANRPTIGIEQDELPRVILVGAAYRLSDQADLSADLVKDIRFPESVRVGIEVRPLEFVALRTGISTEPPRFHAGAGVRYRSLGFDYGVATHQELGLTHSLGLSVAL